MLEFPDLDAPDFFAKLIANLNPAESRFELPPDYQIGHYTLIGFLRPAGPWYLRRDDIILMIKQKERCGLGSEVYILKLFDERRRVSSGSLESSVLAVKEFWARDSRMEALISRIKDCVATADYKQENEAIKNLINLYTGFYLSQFGSIRS